MGSNMAENHPIAFRFVMQAKEKGATIIHADPRFTRTSALCDIYAPIRAGSDIAFLGGLINYIVNDERWQNDPFFREYVVNYTNISTIIEDDFKDASELDGLFSGWEAEKLSYNVDSWQYRGMDIPATLAEAYVHPSTEDPDKMIEKQQELTRRPVPADPTLQDPKCVYHSQAPLRRLHAGNGRAGHRLPERNFSESGKNFGEQRRPRAYRRVVLRGRLDASYDRRADDSCGSNYPVSPR